MRYEDLMAVKKRWGSSVSIVSDYKLEERSSIPGRDKGFFL
jgi:hypothetical protein